MRLHNCSHGRPRRRAAYEEEAVEIPRLSRLLPVEGSIKDKWNGTGPYVSSQETATRWETLRVSSIVNGIDRGEAFL